MKRFVKAMAAIMLMTAVVFAAGCTPEDEPPVYIVEAFADPSDFGVVVGGGEYQRGEQCTVTATAYDGYSFINWTENDNVVSSEESYTFTVTENRSLIANFDHEYIDLGLPSGTLWAACNVGASSPEGYGDYFAWGETESKTTYNWSTYKYCNGDYDQLTKYCNNSSYGYKGFTDNLTVLQSSDDAATANWGNGWCMPTDNQWRELYQYTTNTWTTQNGVYGRLFTAANGNSLFLPAAGFRWDGGLTSVGSDGDYWSSSLGTGGPDEAWYFGFGSDGYGYGMDDYYRDLGRSVRAVRSARQN